jgi:hypothetical protein
MPHPCPHRYPLTFRLANLWGGGGVVKGLHIYRRFDFCPALLAEFATHPLRFPGNFALPDVRLPVSNKACGCLTSSEDGSYSV